MVIGIQQILYALGMRFERMNVNTISARFICNTCLQAEISTFESGMNIFQPFQQV